MTAHFVRLARMHKCSFTGNLTALVQIRDRSVHGLHTDIGTGFQLRVNLMCFSFTDEISNSVRADHNFHGNHAASSRCRGKQRLAQYAFNNASKLNTDLLLLMRRKYVDDTIYSLSNVDGMQRTENQVAGFRGG